MNLPVPPFPFFRDYRDDVLSELAKTEALLRLDDEIANKELVPRYQGPVDNNNWPKLEAYYSDLFAEFVQLRLDEFAMESPVATYEERFHTFRKEILRLNDTLPFATTATAATLPRPAEQLLLKRLRKQGYDPTTLDISYIERGGPLYLLELFVTAARQQATESLQADGGVVTAPQADEQSQRAGNDHLVETVMNEIAGVGDLSQQEVLEELREPVLMVDLWPNQRKGLDRWLNNDREGILEMATATGKTVAGIAAIAHLCGELPTEANHERLTDDARVMVVAHSNAILNQWERELAEKLGLPAGAISDSSQPDNMGLSTGTIEFRTAHSFLYDPDLASRYDLAIYDEVHHYSNEDGFGKAIDDPNYDAALGLSATVSEDHGDAREAALEDLLAPIVYTFDVSDAIEKDIIPEFDWAVHPTPLDPDERAEWEAATESIRNQFMQVKGDSETRQTLRDLSVPFTQFDDLGDFIQAHKAAGYELDEVPDDWEQLHKAIVSRNHIRHRSQPKIDAAVDLAKEYLTESEQIKLIMFAMDIETTEEIHSRLESHTEHAYVVHSQVASSNYKKDEIVNNRITKFANADHGVLIAPKLLDEGVDVPDAEVGINVAGTKTKLQLVQRMGRILRKHGDQEPTFHHYVMVPEEQDYLQGVDSRAYVQELNWVRELGELIQKQPDIKEANIDPDVLARAEERGHEQWATDLLNEMEVETVQGSVRLDEILNTLTSEAATVLHDQVDFSGTQVTEENWQTAMDTLRARDDMPVKTLQRIWWLFPIYRDIPDELRTLLEEIIDQINE